MDQVCRHMIIVFMKKVSVVFVTMHILLGKESNRTIIKNAVICEPEEHESNSADIGGVDVFNQGIHLISIKLALHSLAFT